MMSMWDVQRDTRDNRILAIRPAGFKGWGLLDGSAPLAIKQEELGADYFRLNAIACDHNGDGLALDAKELSAKASAEALAENPEAIAYLPDNKLLDEVRRRGLAAVIDDAIEETR